MENSVAVFSELKEKLVRLRLQRGVLLAKEEEKSGERLLLETELKSLGVDVGNLDKEEERLQKELQTQVLEVEAQLTEFEKKLQSVKDEGVRNDFDGRNG